MFEEEIANIKNKLQPASTVLYILARKERIPEDFLDEAGEGLQETVEILNRIMKE